MPYTPLEKSNDKQQGLAIDPGQWIQEFLSTGPVKSAEQILSQYPSDTGALLFFELSDPVDYGKAILSGDVLPAAESYLKQHYNTTSPTPLPSYPDRHGGG